MGIHWPPAFKLFRNRKAAPRPEYNEASLSYGYRRLSSLSLSILLLLGVLFIDGLNPFRLLVWALLFTGFELISSRYAGRFFQSKTTQLLIATGGSGFLIGLAPVWILSLLTVQQLFVIPLSLTVLAACAAILLSRDYRAVIIYVLASALPFAVYSLSRYSSLDPAWFIAWAASLWIILLAARPPLSINENETDPVTDQKSSEEAMNDRRLSLLADSNTYGFWDWSIADNGEEVIHHSHFKELFGYDITELEGFKGNILPLIHPEDAENTLSVLTTHLKGESPEYRVRYRIRHLDGHWVWVEDQGEVIVRDERGRAREMTGIRRDITARVLAQEEKERLKEQQKEQLRYLSDIDQLTGLCNRKLFQERLNNLMENRSRGEQPIAVLIINLDRFQSLNDGLGHSFGDKVLKETASRLQNYASSAHTIARLHSDEFAIILDQSMNLSSLSRQADLLISKLNKPYQIEDRRILVGVSIGISLLPGYYQTDQSQEIIDCQTLISQASIAVQHSKLAGSNRWHFFTENLESEPLQQIEMESDLREAIKHQRLDLYYQPKLSLKDDTIRKVEALVRWPHPEKGFISPGQFIPLAELTGQIHELGKWVLNKACLQAVEWQEEGLELQVAVNISPSQLHQGNLFKLVSDALEQSGLAPECLELELTESLLMENREKHIETLKAIRAMGVSISIDDFGTGYSALNYLKELPLDVLKIDQSFIRDLPHSDEDIAITKAIIVMAHSLGLHVVAEGVEKPETLKYLWECGCDEVQGNLISKPQPASVISERLMSVVES